MHNVTELFIYGGLAAIFVPLFNLFSVIILLLLIFAITAHDVKRLISAGSITGYIDSVLK